MQDRLMKAILAMDAYNHGDGRPAEESLVKSGLDLNHISSIGNYTIQQTSDTQENAEEVAADFYAIAYEYNDETVISYRGTDSIWADMREGFCDGFDQW